MRNYSKRSFGKLYRRKSGWTYQRKPMLGYVAVLAPDPLLDTTFLTLRAALRYIIHHEKNDPIRREGTSL